MLPSGSGFQLIGWTSANESSNDNGAFIAAHEQVPTLSIVPLLG